MTFGCEPQRQATRAAEPSSPRLPSRPTVDAPRPSSACDEPGSHPNQLQTPACDRCTQGVMDATNDHLRGLCRCACHTSQLSLPLPEWDGSVPVPYDVIPY